MFDSISPLVLDFPCSVSVFQVKPLLQVTGHEKKINEVENEMMKYKENLEKQKQDTEELERKYAQIIEEKSILAEQLQAETEISAEAEEVCRLNVLMKSC